MSERSNSWPGLVNTRSKLMARTTLIAKLAATTAMTQVTQCVPTKKKEREREKREKGKLEE